MTFTSPFKPVSTLDQKNSLLANPPVSLQPLDAISAKQVFEDWLQDASEKLVGSNDRLRNADVSAFLAAVFQLSPYLYGLAKQFPQTVENCASDGFHQTYEELFAALKDADLPSLDQADLMRELRIAKKKCALIAGLADLGGWWSAQQVSLVISAMADFAVDATVRHLLGQFIQNSKLKQVDPEDVTAGSGYCVLAMGKHGASELNYSSDIDLIVIFDPEAPAILDKEESVSFYVRLTKQLIKILQERTADGYVFRTDLRLRPDPGSMPLAIPLPIALNYYEGRGQNWERAAMIKARLVAGDTDAGKELLDSLSPFIWRRYLDYAAIQDVHSIKRQIQTHRGYNELSVPGHNVKLGRGGIREIEFFVQTQQLIAGGRNPDLRKIKTVDALAALVKAQWLEQGAAEELKQSYAYLRDVEHRLQMINDEQTHTLPKNKEDLQRIALLCGYENLEGFNHAFMNCLQCVEGHYADLFSDDQELSVSDGNLSFTGDTDDPGTLETLRKMGFENPETVIRTIRSWHYGRYPVTGSEKAREQLTELTPALLQSFADTDRGSETLMEFDQLLQSLPQGFQLFSILRANPHLLSLLMRVLSAAPRLAQIIVRRPHVFDGILEPGFFDVLPDYKIWLAGLQRSLSQARDYEDGLDRARIFAAEQRFLIGMRLLSGAVDPKEIGELYSQLAETLLVEMVEWVRKSFEETHGKINGASFAIVGLGNLGTRELTATSDLDIMLIYEFDQQNDTSDGRRPLHGSQYFGRFAQRLIAAMSAPTAQGIMYELDFRLRPDGAAGPIATSLLAFEKYHSQSAEVWEKLALTRARVLGPKTDFSTKIDQAIADARTNLPEAGKIAKDVLDMRQLMDRERASSGPWDIKLAKGGLIDLEFIAQSAVLFQRVQPGDSTAKTLGYLTSDKLQNDNVTWQEVHSIYQGVAQVLRLCLDKGVEPKKGPRAMQELLLQQLQLPDMASAEAYLRDTQLAVRRAFKVLLNDWSANS